MPLILREINVVKNFRNDHFETRVEVWYEWMLAHKIAKNWFHEKSVQNNFLTFHTAKHPTTFLSFGWILVLKPSIKRRSSFLKFVTVLVLSPSFSQRIIGGIIICFKWQCFQLSKVFAKVVNTGKLCSAKIVWFWNLNYVKPSLRWTKNEIMLPILYSFPNLKIHFKNQILVFFKSEFFVPSKNVRLWKVFQYLNILQHNCHIVVISRSKGIII